jgi:hypothetical protein
MKFTKLNDAGAPKLVQSTSTRCARARLGTGRPAQWSHALRRCSSMRVWKPATRPGYERTGSRLPINCLRDLSPAVQAGLLARQFDAASQRRDRVCAPLAGPIKTGHTRSRSTRQRLRTDAALRITQIRKMPAVFCRSHKSKPALEHVRYRARSRRTSTNKSARNNAGRGDDFVSTAAARYAIT